MNKIKSLYLIPLFCLTLVLSSCGSDSNNQIPVFPSGEELMRYGVYPQTYVSDDDLTLELDKLLKPNSQGYYEYDGQEYIKINAQPYNYNTWFHDYTRIIENKSYWFKVEPISWRCINIEDNNALIASEFLLDAHVYNEFHQGSFDDNNYMKSDIREWLNNNFYEKAFENDSLINITEVDNSVKSTGFNNNPHACSNTFD